MTDNIYMEDPNSYIQSLSQVRRSIQKNVWLKLSSSSNHVSQQIQRQIKENFDRYKKSILINQRIQLSKEHQSSEEQKRKQALQQMIESKIKISQQTRDKKKQQLVETKKLQRLMKQAINHSKKEQIRKTNLQKSIQIIEKLQEKATDHTRVPIKLRILEEKIKASRVKSTDHSPFDIKRRSHSQSTLTKIDNRISGSMITQPQYSSLKSHQSTEEIVKKLREIPSIKRSQSLLQAKKKGRDNQEEILQKLIENNQKDSYNDYLLKNSLSYKASNHSRLNQVKSAIQQYLKNPNSPR